MPPLEVSLTDPDGRAVETAAGTWLVAGLAPSTLRAAIEAADGPADVRRRLASVAEDAVAVGVIDGRPWAYRSVTATRSLYHCRTPDGTVVLTDHFRNALRRLPVADRTVPARTVADHLLFRTPIEPDTYVSEVGSVPRGAWLEWNADEGPTVRRRDRIDVDPALDPEEAIAEVDAALGDVIAAGTTGDETLMFSGGVDSTLLGTYLDAPTVSMAIDSPELALERRYVRDTRDHLDADGHRAVDLPESRFLTWLEESMDELGFPSHFGQTVLTHALFADGDAGRYVNGEGADALFGLTGSKGARVAAWLRPLLARTPQPVAARVPGSAGRSVSELHALARQFDRPLADGGSFAQRFAFFTNPGVVGEMVGEDLVARRFRAQRDFVTDRVGTTNAGAATAHLELGHLLSFFQHNTVAQWRQLAHAHGASLLAPFKTERMARCSQSIPADRRYVQGLSGLGSLDAKYLLKRLLTRRLPSYPTGRKKGNGALPLERYFEDGPLADVFDRYEPPSVVPEGMLSDHVDSFGPVTWNLITYAVWRDRVLRNPDVEAVGATVAYRADV
jgi:asparagine synthetase B (glutamine-hydrolysing)